MPAIPHPPAASSPHARRAACRRAAAPRCLRRAAIGTLSLLAAVAAAALAPAAASDDLVRAIGGTIVGISDGDFVGGTYADGKLAPPGERDLLTIISATGVEIIRSHLPVSNSVTAAPEVLSLAPDGRTVFVVERLGERPPGGETVRDLPVGRHLFAVDIADRAAPRLVATAAVANNPEAVAVSPDGRLVAVATNTPDAAVVELVPWADGALGAPVRFDLADLGVKGTAEAPRGGVTTTNVQWHPSGRFLAVNLNTIDTVAFFAIDTVDGVPRLTPWGAPVKVGKDPFVGRFTPDGRHYLTSDWGRDFTAKDLAGRLPDRASEVSVVRLADPTSAEPVHARIGGTATDVAAEGIAVSPDGRLVATVNMRTTAFPPSSPRFAREATVTLLAFDPETGAIEKLADTPFEAVLPEGATFDLTGEHLLVTVFHAHGAGADRTTDQLAGDGPDGRTGAGLEVFRIVRGNRPSLQRLGRIPMPHGVHHVAVTE